MPRIGGERGRPEVKPLTPRQQKEARDDKRRMRVVMIEEERLRWQHFTDRMHLCPICLDTCNGFMARSKRAALCLRRPSSSPDDYQLGWWHAVRGRVCNCGKRHEAQPI